MSGTSVSVETANSPQQLCSRCITTSESALGVGGEIAFYMPAESGERVPVNRRISFKPADREVESAPA